MVADDAVEGRIRAEQLNSIRRYLLSITVANAFNALVLVVALWPSPQRQLAVVWAAVIVAFVTYHGIKNLGVKVKRPSYVSRRAIVRAARNALLLGSMWATLPLLFFANASAGGQIIIACLCAGMLGGGAFAFASLPAAAIAFTIPIVVGSTIAIGRSSDPAYLLVALLMISYIAVLLRGVFVHAAQIARRVSEQIQAERKIRLDELTDLPNRLALFEGLESAFARSARLNGQFAILYLDLNDFKNINDKLGHVIGDKLLVQVGQRLMACVRDGDLVARLSGDEFAVIVAQPTSSGDAANLAGQIVSCLDVPFSIEGVEVFSSACIGIALAPTDGASPEPLLKSADEALYTAKRGVGGAIQLYNSGSKEHNRRRRSVERDLRDALRREEFFLVFQPIMALDTDRIGGCEALLRWRHPTLGVRSPKEFINIVEETGLIHEVGNRVIHEACRTAASWPNDMRVAVNVSPLQLRETSFLSRTIDALRESKLRPRRLELEITETAFMDESAYVLSNLNALRELGIRIALDDFGTGYSSLTYLRKLSPDCIKIDGSFVREVLTDLGSASIVKSMIALSMDLHINVVAEGIETAEQLSFLRRHGCGEGQGYFICMPKSANELAAFLQSRAVAGTAAA
jgi:diguanylate cyclase